MIALLQTAVFLASSPSALHALLAGDAAPGLALTVVAAANLAAIEATIRCALLSAPLPIIGAPAAQLASPFCGRRPKRRRAVAVAAGVAFAATSAGADEERASRARLLGYWATPGFGSIVELRSCADPKGAALCGRILWLWQDRDEAGRPRADRENSDPRLRSRPLVGIEMLRGFRETAPGVWEHGTVYNPDDGRTYTGSIRAAANGTLSLEGCALRVFCASQTWHRPDSVLASATAAMEQASGAR